MIVYSYTRERWISPRMLKQDVLGCSVVSDFVTPWTAACQAPLSMGFFRQEYWSGLLFLIPRDLPDPWIELVSLIPPALAGGFFITLPPGRPCATRVIFIC